MTVFIKRNQFLGASKVFTNEPDGLTRVIREIVRTQAQIAINSNTTALTDNSTGTVSSTIGPIRLAFTGITEAGNNAVTKAAIETAFGDVQQAFSDLVGQISNINAVVPILGVGGVVNSVGVAAGLTIPAIPQVFTGAAAAMASVTGASTLLAAYVSALNQIVTMVNALSPAVKGTFKSDLDVQSGGYELTNALGLADNFSTTVAALETSTGTQSDGTALAQIAVTEAGTVFTALANAIASVAHVLNEIRTIVTPLNVVAVG